MTCPVGSVVKFWQLRPSLESLLTWLNLADEDYYVA